MENAFNCVDRSAVRAGIRRVAPELARWVDLCYSEVSHVQFGPYMLDSAGGVQQGDTLGPALFAMAIQIEAESARTNAEETLNINLDWWAFFLDDGAIACIGDVLAYFAHELVKNLASIGLKVNMTKTELVATAGRSHNLPVDSFPAFKVVVEKEFKLLGTPFGSPGYILGKIAKRLDRARVIMEKASKLKNAHRANLILRNCAGCCRLVYNTRTMPPAIIGPVLKDYGDMLKHCMTSIVQENIPDASWTLAQLGISNGGIGMRDPRLHAEAAYLAAFTAGATLAHLTH